MTFNASFNPSGGGAIVGLGMTEMTREYTYSSTGLAAIAVRNAITDAGRDKSDVDGILVNPGIMGNLQPDLQKALGLENVRLQTKMDGRGSTAGQMVQYASLAVQSGLANVVVCVFADDPLRGGRLVLHMVALIGRLPACRVCIAIMATSARIRVMHLLRVDIWHFMERHRINSVRLQFRRANGHN